MPLLRPTRFIAKALPTSPFFLLQNTKETQKKNIQKGARLCLTKSHFLDVGSRTAVAKALVIFSLLLNPYGQTPHKLFVNILA
jgi:hypothetical protein